MYSFFESEEIDVLDWEGLLDIIEKYKQIKDEDCYISDIVDDMIERNPETGEPIRFTFEPWDNIKLISYWYNSEVIFLELISEFIEGYVRWSFETPDEAGEVMFMDGKCIIRTGQMTYSESSATDFLGGDKDISVDIKKLLLAKKLKK